MATFYDKNDKISNGIEEQYGFKDYFYLKKDRIFTFVHLSTNHIKLK